MIALGVLLSLGLATGSKAPPPNDYDGDGKSDYVTTRAEATHASEGGTSGLGPSGAALIAWYLLPSGGGSTERLVLGHPTTDFITPADFDGDGRIDLAVWRASPPVEAAFYLLESRSGRVRTEPFGQFGDDPLIVGDYDGDGKADPAVFRCPPHPGPCTFFYRGSRRNPDRNVTYLPFGFGTQTTLFPCPGDYDGDGRLDLCLQRTDPDRPGQGQFVLMRSSDQRVEYVSWGRDTDRVAPGDYDGDGRDDFMVVRTEGERLIWHALLSAGRGDLRVELGLAGDRLTPGDYDGDGTTDPSVWRAGGSDEAPSMFVTVLSSTGKTSFTRWGLSSDYPPAEVPVH